jgi:hypothetical protein
MITAGFLKKWVYTGQVVIKKDGIMIIKVFKKVGLYRASYDKNL